MEPDTVIAADTNEKVGEIQEQVSEIAEIVAIVEAKIESEKSDDEQEIEVWKTITREVLELRATVQELKTLAETILAVIVVPQVTAEVTAKTLEKPSSSENAADLSDQAENSTPPETPPQDSPPIVEALQPVQVTENLAGELAPARNPGRRYKLV